MKSAITIFFVWFLFFLCTSGANAQESPEKTCGNAIEYYKQFDINKALEEAKWCVEALQKVQRAQLAVYFKDKIAGFSGEELKSSDMGAGVRIQRTYNKGNDSIQVTFTSHGGQGANPYAYEMLAQMGMMQGGEKVRIQERTAFISSLKKGEHSRVILMVHLNNGGSVEFRSRQLDSVKVRKFAESFPIAELDKAAGG